MEARSLGFQGHNIDTDAWGLYGKSRYSAGNYYGFWTCGYEEEKEFFHDSFSCVRAHLRMGKVVSKGTQDILTGESMEERAKEGRCKEEG